MQRVRPVFLWVGIPIALVVLGYWGIILTAAMFSSSAGPDTFEPKLLAPTDVPVPLTASDAPSIDVYAEARDIPNAIVFVARMPHRGNAVWLERNCHSEQDWQRYFIVYKVENDRERSRIPMAGTYGTEFELIWFASAYPAKAGVRYMAIFDPLGRLASSGNELPLPSDLATGVLNVPARSPTQFATVTSVFPSTDALPENQLKFYLHFSAAMSRGEAYEHIHLREASGKEVEHPFLELDQELWDPAGKRFTLFIDPGRIKRGLKPREEIGPSLEAGKSYTLEIDAGWHDAEGNPLKEAFRKSFRVGPPIEEVVDVKAWKLQAPLGTNRPLRVTFPRPLDHAMLERVLKVTISNGRTVEGTIAIKQNETEWEFTPKTGTWLPGDFNLVVDTELEDLAGNSIAKPFEVDVFHPVQREVKTKTVSLPFQVK